ncbi:hypothetical protein [Streptomyces sp. NBC_00124]|uniref:hypothetical protein n=1 Tax=Streptomyces sp. NBC_00124 TaxID=2975662 RepID=UPI002259BB39|nr:hypothetical protein [Streptomyces sp. NBC_00124]
MNGIERTAGPSSQSAERRGRRHWPAVVLLTTCCAVLAEVRSNAAVGQRARPAPSSPRTTRTSSSSSPRSASGSTAPYQKYKEGSIFTSIRCTLTCDRSDPSVNETADGLHGAVELVGDLLEVMSGADDGFRAVALLELV